MTRWVNAFEQRLYRIESWVCSLCLIIMLLTVFLGVCVRVFNWPIPNVAEWALAAMSPLTFVGSAMCARKRAHIAIDVIDQLPFPWLLRVSNIFVAFLMFAFAVIYAWLGWGLLEDALLTRERWLDMGTPLYIPISFFFAGMVCMAFHGLCDLFRQFATGASQPQASA